MTEFARAVEFELGSILKQLRENDAIRAAANRRPEGIMDWSILGKKREGGKEIRTIWFIYIEEIFFLTQTATDGRVLLTAADRRLVIRGR
eukprot:4900580-Pleurochrysis_carterae.AAC.1